MVVSGATLNKDKDGLKVGVQMYKCLIPGTFAMTFDDGPSQYTPQLLGILRSMNVTSTFFVVGEMVDSYYGEVLSEMVADGHHLASHTYSHPHLNQLNDELIVKEIVSTAEAIERRVGFRPDYFRCPYGECDERVLSILGNFGYKVINWNLDTLDWANKSSDQIAAAYQDGLVGADPTTSTYISLQHDIQKNTIPAVSQIIQIVRDKGFKLTTVKECMGE
ncbi:hypothetical protein L0F63_001025 [Massospora cicadina]|nr:hypothetical protein L0F63_001025 [Massospora cicadina]